MNPEQRDKLLELVKWRIEEITGPIGGFEENTKEVSELEERLKKRMEHVKKQRDELEFLKQIQNALVGGAAQ